MATTNNDKNTEIMVLSEVEKTEISKAFSEANDFRSLWEKITEPLDSIFVKVSSVIDKDPIMNVNDELAKMNSSVKEVHSDIMGGENSLVATLKKFPLIWGLFWKMDAYKFNKKALTEKIDAVFIAFDTTYDSVNSSIELQKTFIEWLDANLSKVAAYRMAIEEKIKELNVRLSEETNEEEKARLDMFLRNVTKFSRDLSVLVWNLEFARKRLLIRLDAAYKISLSMNSSRPIFKVLLSSAVIEASSQKAIDASIEAIDHMWATIDQMTSEITDKTIEGAKRAEELSNKTVLSSSNFVDNVNKLKNYFEEIETHREAVKKETENEQKLFEEARKNLNSFKVLSADWQEALLKEVSK